MIMMQNRRTIGVPYRVRITPRVPPGADFFPRNGRTRHAASIALLTFWGNSCILLTGGVRGVASPRVPHPCSGQNRSTVAHLVHTQPTPPPSPHLHTISPTTCQSNKIYILKISISKKHQ